jgi:beta-galactosidase
VREIAGHEKFVTTCIAYARPAVDDPSVTAALDITAGNPYYAMQDGLALPTLDGEGMGWASWGAWSVFHSADRMYSSRQERFLVTETNASSIGGPAMNFPGYDGQWRQVAWAMIARGARMIEYWHWHTTHFGAETYWGGVLPHDQRPGRVYEQIARLGRELESSQWLLDGLEPNAHVGFLWSNASVWGLAGQPSLAKDGVEDPASYSVIVNAFYRGAFAAGLPVRFIHDTQILSDRERLMDPAALVAKLPVLVVPALYVASDTLLEWVLDYAKAGGHVVLGPRTAYADPQGRARREVKPALLAPHAGVGYQEFSNLTHAVPVASYDEAFPLTAGGYATKWIDGLVVDGADVVLGYDHPHHGRFAAVATAVVGNGRITTVGTVPDDALGRAVFRWIAESIDDPWLPLNTGSVTVTTASAAGGSRVRIVHNWSWEPVTIVPPVAVEDALAAEAGESTLPVCLGPWDVKVFVEA